MFLFCFFFFFFFFIFQSSEQTPKPEKIVEKFLFTIGRLSFVKIRFLGLDGQEKKEVGNGPFEGDPHSFHFFIFSCCFPFSLTKFVSF